MKSSSARILSLLLLLVFTGCSLGGSGDVGNPTQTLEQKILSERNLKHDASLELRLVSATAAETTIQVLLHNPGKQKIASIRAWVSYPTALLKGQKVDFGTSN